MRGRSFRGPRLDPPDPPDPECLECGDYDVTRDSLENGTPLCEAHDDQVRREVETIQLGLEKASEAQAYYSSRMGRDEPKDQVERMAKNHRREGENIRNLKARLKDIQAECDHPDVERRETVYEEDDFENVPEDEMPDDVPVVSIYERCRRCGHEEHRQEPA